MGRKVSGEADVAEGGDAIQMDWTGEGGQENLVKFNTSKCKGVVLGLGQS